MTEEIGKTVSILIVMERRTGKMKKDTFTVTEKELREFEYYLKEKESARSTIEKYLRDVRNFLQFTGYGNPVGKEELLRYKEWLIENYAVSSVNSMLVALNQLLIFLEKGRLRLKRVKVQRTDVMCMEKELEKEEYCRLVQAARSRGKEQLAMIMETMCATGIRVSELKYFRVESIRGGVIRVWNKGKYRFVILPEILRKKLLLYIGKHGIRRGYIFCTRSGCPKNRSNIWKEMKELSGPSGIDPKKIFPHNMRHLFARTFYRATKNLINLADILGHSNLEVTRRYAGDGIREWRKNIELLKMIEDAT